MCANGRNELRRGRSGSHHATWRAAEELALGPLVESPPRRKEATWGRLSGVSVVTPFPLLAHTNAVSQTLSVKRALETERGPWTVLSARGSSMANTSLTRRPPNCHSDGREAERCL